MKWILIATLHGLIVPGPQQIYYSESACNRAAMVQTVMHPESPYDFYAYCEAREHADDR